MIYVLDSCVGFKWLVVEPDTDKAGKVRDGFSQLTRILANAATPNSRTAM